MAEIRKYRPGVKGAVAEAIARAVAEGIQPAGAAAPPVPGEDDLIDDEDLLDEDEEIEPPRPVTPPRGIQLGRVSTAGAPTSDMPSAASALPGTAGTRWNAFVVPAPKEPHD